MNQIEYFTERLKKIAEEAREAIVSLLKENNLTSVNFVPYTGEGYVDNHIFFDVDKDGYGVGLWLDVLTYKKGKVTLKMSANEDSYCGQQNLSELSANECVAVLEMLTQAIELSKEEGIPVLAEGQDFYDE